MGTVKTKDGKNQERDEECVRVEKGDYDKGRAMT